MKKKIIMMILLFISLMLLSCCIHHSGKTDNVEIIYGDSTKFDREEIESAIDTVLIEFEKLEDCELLKLWYDENESNREIEYFVERGVQAENMILLMSDFYVARNRKDTTLNHDYTYTDWKWWLFRNSKADNWVVTDYGY